MSTLGIREPRRITNGDETDVHSRWRGAYCWTQRAGECKRVKRSTNRRERQEAKSALRKADLS